MKIVKYTQPSCTPCKMVEAFLNHAGLVVDESVVLGQDLSFDDARDNLGIMKTPTIILFDDNGQELDRVSSVGQGKIQEIFSKRG